MERDPLNLAGTTIDDKYEVERVVGEGGFSVVYRARHIIWKQPVALKCFKVVTHASEEQRQELLSAFVQEGKLMTDLSTRTSAIVQARDIGTLTREDGAWIPYMVLEWLEGEPLDVILDRSAAEQGPPRPVEHIVEMFNAAAEALALAHKRNVVHRDIKPANLFVVRGSSDADEAVKILDFGVAKVMQEHLEHDKALKQTSAVLTAFTPTYGAPEQFTRTYGATGPWTDVFAFALVLVELMQNGKPALAGEDFLVLAQSSANERVRPTPRHHGIVVSDAVEAVFRKALAVQPADRHANMRDFWCDLRAAVFPGEAKWTPPSLGAQSLRGSGAGGLLGSSTPPLDLQETALASDTGPGPTADGGAITTGAPQTTTLAVRSKSRLLPAVLGAAIASAVLAGGFFALRASMQPDSAVASASGAALVAIASASASAASGPACPEGMGYVPGGKFFMGSDDAAYPRWQPAHKVELSAYCLDVNEVTAGQYKACSDIGECKRANTDASWPKPSSQPDAEHERNERIYSELCTFGKEGLENHPINCVTWQAANDYCAVHHKRLPTEAEWEFAARGSDGRVFPWGDTKPTHEHMNACGSECNGWEKEKGVKQSARMYDADDGFGATSPVGSFPAGKTMFGMHDMVGNVFEWTQDWNGAYTKDELRNPTGPARGDGRVIRGGAFNGGFSLWVNPAFRYAMDPEAHTHGIGFRCAKSLP